MTHKDMQVRIIGNFGLNESVPELKEVPYSLFVKRISELWITCCVSVPTLKRSLAPSLSYS